MARPQSRPRVSLDRLRDMWRRLLLRGGIAGIAAVALATAAMGVACAAITLVATLVL